MSMNVVHSGNTFQIYGDSLKTYNNLPVGTYEVGFSKFTGFFLTSRDDLTVNEEKVYGNTEKRVRKVLDAFDRVDRNFGIILSGRKGIGKSLFARMLASHALSRDLPMIVVKSYVPGIADFISSIDQRVVFLFDEFEKTFADTDSGSPQEEMLPLFDGLDGGKKLFVITCNEVGRLNNYLLNRPGRFHYHFILGNPSADEIREYMTDKLLPQYHELIKKIITFSINVDLTYDILRAIAFELNNGYSFEETLMDLNISKESTPKFCIRVEFADGTVRTAEEKVNSYSGEDKCIWFYGRDGVRSDAIRLTFKPSDILVDADHALMTLDPNKADRYVDEYYFDMDVAEEKAHYEYLKNIGITKITFIRKAEDLMYKYMV